MSHHDITTQAVFISTLSSILTAASSDFRRKHRWEQDDITRKAVDIADSLLDSIRQELENPEHFDIPSDDQNVLDQRNPETTPHIQTTESSSPEPSDAHPGAEHDASSPTKTQIRDTMRRAEVIGRSKPKADKRLTHRAAIACLNYATSDVESVSAESAPKKRTEALRRAEERTEEALKFIRKLIDLQ